MTIDPALIQKLAMLSRIRLTDEEITRYASQMTRIVEYVEQLQEVETSHATRVRQISGLENVTREDSPEPYKATEDLLNAFPERDGRTLSVPNIL
ncbi:MAG: Asp-tRNA(Asn)/Glu-tRNA(Gln) amidotransferase subunit GatC [Candidatus Kerfeldbacteria bacterium]|nr:Asp-tRNA(Asn)/Glu-tRNA(Gln) amidotransferase subunit GatC [Candidatus Kerfeldbacteria bacterium]